MKLEVIKKIINEEVDKINLNKNEDLNYNIKKIRSFDSSEGHFSVYDYEDNPQKRSPMFIVWENKFGWVVRNSFVPDELQKKGIATDFYLKMNQESIKKTGKPLRSSPPRKLNNGETIHSLSDAGKELWNSLERKGYAIKIDDDNFIFKR